MTVGKDRSFASYTEEEWLAWRRRGVGGSDAPVIMGLSPYKGWLTLYIEKTDRGLDPREPNEAAYWGQTLEEVVAREFEKRSGLRVTEPTSKLIQHPIFPWMLGTPDRYVTDQAGRTIGILECKTTAARRDTEWEDGPAPYAYCQLQHYLAVTGFQVGWIAVLIGGQLYKHFEVPRDQDYIDELIAKETEFWSHVEADTAPPADAKESTSAVINSRFAESVRDSSVELTGDALAAARRLRELGTSARLDLEVAEHKNTVKLALGEFEVGMVDGEPIISWRSQSRRVFDLERFRREHPDLAREYLSETTSRIFRVHTRRHAGDFTVEDE